VGGGSSLRATGRATSRQKNDALYGISSIKRCNILCFYYFPNVDGFSFLDQKTGQMQNIILNMGMIGLRDIWVLVRILTSAVFKTWEAYL
jgi:hypothetical protein